MRRGKDAEWDLYGKENITWDKVPIAVLMDIRDELKSLNALLHCSNFMAIPWKLDKVVANTRKPKKKKRLKAVTA